MPLFTIQETATNCEPVIVNMVCSWGDLLFYIKNCDGSIVILSAVRIPDRNTEVCLEKELEKNQQKTEQTNDEE